jgi:putative phosphoribosyl transferase
MSVPRETVFEVIGLELDGMVAVPERPRGVVLFVHAVGGDRQDPADVTIGAELDRRQVATVMVNLLTAREREADDGLAGRFDATVPGPRVVALIDDLAAHGPAAGLPLGMCATGSGAAGALIAAAARPDRVRALLCRAGRPDLAGEFVRLVSCPTLLAVGEPDHPLREINERAVAQFPGTARVATVPGASVLRAEPAAIDLVAELAGEWFPLRLGAPHQASARR